MDAPADSPDTVVAYDVLDTSGALLCSTAETTCSFPTGARGVDGMTVRSYNAQGEGDQPRADRRDAVASGADREGGEIVVEEEVG